jgi:hypothetical protein
MTPAWDKNPCTPFSHILLEWLHYFYGQDYSTFASGIKKEMSIAAHPF